MTTDTPVTRAATALNFLSHVFDDARHHGGDPDLCRERAMLMLDLAAALHASPARIAPASALVHGLNILASFAADTGQDGRAEMLHQRLVLATMVAPSAPTCTAAEAVPIWEAFVAWHEEQIRILTGRSHIPGAPNAVAYQTRRDVYAAELGHLRAFAQEGR